MKRTVSPTYALLVSTSLALLALNAGCGSASTKSDTPETKTESATVADSASKPASAPATVMLTQAQYSSAGITLGTTQSRAMNTTLKVNGVIDVPPQSQYSVTVPYGGYIRSIKLEPGARVRKGQTLAVLENPEFIALQQDYLETKARLEYADLEYARQQELSRENVNAVKVLQKARADRQTLQAQLAGLAQRLMLIGIRPATLQADHLTRTIVVPSPVAGYVTEVPINNGRFVNSSDVIIEVTDVADIHVHLSVFEKDITRIRSGQAVQFSLGNSASLTHRATVFMKGKSIAADRTIPVLARPATGSDDFIPGAYVSAQIAVANQPLPVLPEAAVVSFGGKSYIYVLETRSGQPVQYRFRQIEVKTGIAQDGYLAVTLPATLDVSQTPIVITGAYSLLSQQNNSEEE
jgi:cobalt-zinc-cadmium efflux system membrane fusion protein